MEERLAGVGATVMGRNMFGGGPGAWSDDPWNGWWGDEPPFHHPVFVVTHHPREPLTLGETTFTFVTDGVESAVRRAREAAAGKDVALSGGADVAQQCLAAGLVDELEVSVAPVLLGDGAPSSPTCPAPASRWSSSERSRPPASPTSSTALRATVADHAARSTSSTKRSTAGWAGSIR